MRYFSLVDNTSAHEVELLPKRTARHDRGFDCALNGKVA